MFFLLLFVCLLVYLENLQVHIIYNIKPGVTFAFYEFSFIQTKTQEFAIFYDSEIIKSHNFSLRFCLKNQTES